MDLHTKPESELLKKFTKCGYIYKSPAIGDKHQLLLSCLHCNEVFCQLENFMEHSLKHLELGDFYADAVQEDSIDMENTIIKTEKIECQSETLNPDVIVLKQEDSNRKVYYDILEQEDNEFFELLPETIKSENNEGIERPANIDGHHVRENDNHIEDDCDPEVELELLKMPLTKSHRSENNSPGTAETILHRLKKSEERYLSEISELKTDVKVLTELTNNQNKIIVDLVSEVKVILKTNLSPGLHSAKYMEQFPITSEAELEDVENEICDETKDSMITTVKNILSNGGIRKNLGSIFDVKLLMKFNIDGRKGKNRLMDYKKLMDVIYKSVLVDHENISKQRFIGEMRKAIRLLKNKQYKNDSIFRAEKGDEF